MTDSTDLDLAAIDEFRVLVVDDENSILNEVKRQLAQPQIKVLAAATAHEAFDLLEARYVDAAIVDIQLDGVEAGREILRKMRVRAPAATAIIATKFTDGLGDYIGIDQPKLAQVIKKDPKIARAWALDALAKSLQAWHSSRVDLRNLDFAIGLLEERAERIPRLRFGEELAFEVDRLCRRLFGSVSAEAAEGSEIRVELSPIHREGLSPAITVEATVHLGSDHAERELRGTPAVLKIGPADAVAREAERYHRFVKYGVPLMHRVEMLGHAEDQSLGAVCYSFAGRVTGTELESLDELFRTPERQTLVREVMDSLFGKPSRSWYAVTGEAISALHYVDSTYQTNFGQCQRVFEDVARSVADRCGDQVRFAAPDDHTEGRLTAGNAKLRLPPRRIWGEGAFIEGLPTCLVHGDMHGGNVMVELNRDELTRVCLIDYGNAGPGPRLADFSVLDASVRLADAQLILDEFGIDPEHELGHGDDGRAAFRQAIMKAASRVHEERRLLEATWEHDWNKISADEAWARTTLHLSLLADANFKNLAEREYLAMALPCAYRHIGFKVSHVARIRFVAWISALYERLAA